MISSAPPPHTERTQRYNAPRRGVVRLLDAVALDVAEQRGVRGGADRVKVVLFVDELVKANDAVAVYDAVAECLSKPQRGAVVSTLSYVPVLVGEGVLPQHSGSRRPLVWLQLPALDARAWCAANGVDREAHRRLYVLSGGHPRTMQHVRQAVAEEPDASARELVAVVNHLRYGQAPTTAAAFAFAALANMRLPLYTADGAATTFGAAVQSGALINAHVVGQEVPPAVPLISLFDFCLIGGKNAWLRALRRLVMLVADELDGKAFERVHVLHTAAMLALHNMARDADPVGDGGVGVELGGASLADLQLFHGTKPTGANVLFGEAKFLHVPTGSTIKSMTIDVGEAAGDVLTVSDDLWTAPEQGWTRAPAARQLLPGTRTRHVTTVFVVTAQPRAATTRSKCSCPCGWCTRHTARTRRSTRPWFCPRSPASRTWCCSRTSFPAPTPRRGSRTRRC